jgi:hypothetical protein
MGPLGIVTVGVDSIADVEWLEGRIRITEFLLVLLTPAYFLFMPGEMAPINMASCIPELVDVPSDVLFDFLVSCSVDALKRVVDDIPPSSTLEEFSPIAMLVDEAAPARVAIGSWRSGLAI